MLIHREGASKVCLFSSYFKSNQIPYYVRFYLKELRRFFDQVVMLTNDDREIEAADIGWLKDEGIDLMLVPNEGFDFGMWQKALPLLDIERLERLALVNDSCILFAPLNDFFFWLKRTKPDVAGMTASNEKARHLQSYFLVFQGRSILQVGEYLAANQVSGMAYNDIVNVFEVGLSAWLMNEGGCALAARYEFVPRCDGNPMYLYVAELIQAGMPMIKKRVVANESVGKSMRQMLMEGRSPIPSFYLEVIEDKCRLSDVEMEALFAGTRLVGKHNRLQFWRRYLRYRLMLVLGFLRKKECDVRVVV